MINLVKVDVESMPASTAASSNTETPTISIAQLRTLIRELS